MKLFFGVMLIVWLGASALAAPPAVPTYLVARAAKPITIDGKIDDAGWAPAKAVELVLNRDGSASPAKTTARLLYDDKFLYISFRAVDDNIFATMKHRDDHLWEEEVVEVFLQPDPLKKNYIELEVNPLDALVDIYLLDIRKPLHLESWNSEKIRWAIQVDGTVDGRPGDREWTCEIAFPFEDAVTAAHTPPRPGDRWRMNLYRVEQKPSYALIAWAPTRKDDFHIPSMFGELVFGR
jgi:hypothetical protein